MAMEAQAPKTNLLLIIIITSLITNPSLSQTQEQEEPFTSILISQKGLNFIKTLLITKAISSSIPLYLPTISKSINYPFLGSVHISLSNITIYEFGVSSSSDIIIPHDDVSIIAKGVTCNLSINWEYDYFSWVGPFKVSDKGNASVLVEGMDIELTIGLENKEGTLKMNLTECDCHVKNISIKLDGGASWLYQGMLNAFQEEIGSAVENAITKNLREGILKLDSFLQSLPKEIPVDDYSSLNVTFLNEPFFSNSSIGFDINGLFRARETNPTHKLFEKNTMPPVFCTDNTKMIGISLDEAVFNSASALYYDAEFMHWIVDKVPDQSLLNTAGWRFIIPQLYKKYPKDDMNLNITLSSPPMIKILERNLDATMYADLTIDVLQEDQTIPVACISLVIRGSGSVQISGNNLTGSVKLNDFTMSQNWSDIGNLRLYLIQPVMRTIIQTVFLPFANTQLSKGFPLPIVHGFTLKDAISRQNKEVFNQLKRQNKPYVKSIKSSDEDIIDCVKLTDQPAFVHPLLKNHTIQLLPTFDLEWEQSKQIDEKPITQLWELSGSCPDGTIPIKRIKRNILLRESFFANKNLSINSKKSSKAVYEEAGAYVYGGKYFGARGNINIWNPQVQKGEFSKALISVIGSNNPDTIVDSIEAGWHVNPTMNGDSKTRLFFSWTNKGDKNFCYDLRCPGFVQVSKKVVIGGVLMPYSVYGSKQQFMLNLIIWRDSVSGHWWLIVGKEKVGYWPKSLFSYLRKGASRAMWTGRIKNYIDTSDHHTTTQMGSGHFATEDYGKASYISNIYIADERNNMIEPSLLSYISRPECYSFTNPPINPFFRTHIYFGGPGRNKDCEL
ncbi:hypothetical protein ACFE04_016451 [Oxalis oulophora]